MGGKAKNKHANKKVAGTQGRSTKTKTPVVGMVERGGKLVAKVVGDTKAVTLLPMVATTVSGEAKVYTDEYVGYKPLKRVFDHKFVKHMQAST